MKTTATALLFIGLAASVSACGGKPAQSPENAAQSGDGGGSAASDKSETPVASSGSPSGGPAAAGDEPEKKKSPCGGFDVPDLAAVLSQSECEVGPPKEGAQPRDVKDTLDIKVEADSPKIAPGTTSTITVIFKNKGKGDLPLDFVVDPEPSFDFEVYTLKGARVDAPRSKAPALPPDIANAPVDRKVARVTLTGGGTAHLTLKWNAVKYKWASKERAKGALPGRGYPMDPAGPLPKGKYVLRVITPLTGVFEGSDHEWSQPRTQVEVGSL